MTTILGHHISLIRPMKPRNPIIYNSDLPRPKYNIKPKTIASGKVKEVTVKLKNGGIRSICKPVTHVQVCELFKIPFDQVLSTGWVLEDGTELWR